MAYACGNNHYGQLGIGSYEYDVCTPQKVLIEEKIKDIKIYEYNQTYFITINDEVYACGDNNVGQLGIGSTSCDVCFPEKVLIEEKIKDINIYYNRTYFITFNNEVYQSGQFDCGSYNYNGCVPQKVKK